MFGMRERLKLPRLLARPRTETAFFLPRSFCDVRQELRLRKIRFGGEARVLADVFDGREVHVRSDVLFARIREHIFHEPVPVISAQSSTRKLPRKKFLGVETVIERQQLAACQQSR